MKTQYRCATCATRFDTKMALARHAKSCTRAYDARGRKTTRRMDEIRAHRYVPQHMASK